MEIDYFLNLFTNILNGYAPNTFSGHFSNIVKNVITSPDGTSFDPNIKTFKTRYKRLSKSIRTTILSI